MEIIKNAVAGTVESSDIMITVKQNDANEVAISLDSSVEKQYGQQIRQVIKTTLNNLGVTSAKIDAVDKGALDCTIQARLITAVYRSAGKDAFDWKEIDSWNA
ncbi:citrate lyase acyl carrier protein [Enterococcus sp. HY326]|uniref:citrate lyase acyl carrier protein n=1 Tax=Enterococcus sp. HY326 TaxID=2971265 RepID=UPI00224054AA|nr:citrate lyase acyl carrier protein [Enterococcus sp. HY326]